MYVSVLIGGYFASLPQFGRHDTSALKFGLQKKAIDWRAGVMTSVSLIRLADGATTRCRVDRRTSLLQRANKSPTFTTIVPGYIYSTNESKSDIKRTYDRYSGNKGTCMRILHLQSTHLPRDVRTICMHKKTAYRILEKKRQGTIIYQNMLANARDFE